ncbi:MULTISPECIES: hypothetical protein [Xanthomonas]|nr:MULTISPECIES: hypothetical protein [Xanthomonas]
MHGRHAAADVIVASSVALTLASAERVRIRIGELLPEALQAA